MKVLFGILLTIVLASGIFVCAYKPARDAAMPYIGLAYLSDLQQTQEDLADMTDKYEADEEKIAGINQTGYGIYQIATALVPADTTVTDIETFLIAGGVTLSANKVGVLAETYTNNEALLIDALTNIQTQINAALPGYFVSVPSSGDTQQLIDDTLSGVQAVITDSQSKDTTIASLQQQVADIQALLDIANGKVTNLINAFTQIQISINNAIPGTFSTVPSSSDIAVLISDTQAGLNNLTQLYNSTKAELTAAQATITDIVEILTDMQIILNDELPGYFLQVPSFTDPVSLANDTYNAIGVLVSRRSSTITNLEQRIVELQGQVADLQTQLTAASENQSTAIEFGDYLGQWNGVGAYYVISDAGASNGRNFIVEQWVYYDGGAMMGWNFDQSWTFEFDANTGVIYNLTYGYSNYYIIRNGALIYTGPGGGIGLTFNKA